MAELTRLYLFIHPVPCRKEACAEYLARWRKLIAAEGSRKDAAVCLIANAPREIETLKSLARKHFRSRCIIDPDDDSPETRLLIYDDLRRLMSERGNHNSWLPYELWTSNNARHWTEGLKKGLRESGFTYRLDRLKVTTCGMSWDGCLIKYSMFMGRYLGLTRPPDLRADLSPEAGHPCRADFAERLELSESVYLFLFKLADGRPMGQFIDGLRAVWEPPHLARVAIKPEWVEVIATTPNDFIKVQEAAVIDDDGITVDVGDGCHPAFTTIIGNRISFADFRKALKQARILKRREIPQLSYRFPYEDPVTISRPDN